MFIIFLYRTQPSNSTIYEVRDRGRVVNTRDFSGKTREDTEACVEKGVRPYG